MHNATMDPKSVPWKRLIKDVAPTIALLLLFRVSILPNHGTRFLSLHPCREEAGLHLMILLTLLLCGLSLLLSYRASEKFHQRIFFFAGLASAAFTVLEVIQLPSYHWRLTHYSSTLEYTLLAALVWLALWFLISFLQKPRSFRWLHILAAIPLFFSAQALYRVSKGNAMLQQMNQGPRSLGPTITLLFLWIGIPALAAFGHWLLLRLRKKPLPSTSSLYLEFFTIAISLFAGFTLFSCTLG
jgi:hypothetical protein